MPKRTAVDRRPGALRRKVKSTASVPESAQPPPWIKPQLTRLADEAPAGSDCWHEIKYDGYRCMHPWTRKVQLPTRTGHDWSNLYPYTVSALRALRAKTAYIDGRLARSRRTARHRSSVAGAMDQGRTTA